MLHTDPPAFIWNSVIAKPSAFPPSFETVLIKQLFMLSPGTCNQQVKNKKHS